MKRLILSVAMVMAAESPAGAANEANFLLKSAGGLAALSGAPADAKDDTQQRASSGTAIGAMAGSTGLGLAIGSVAGLVGGLVVDKVEKTQTLW